MATKRPDGRVQPGQRISSAFSARAWNRAQDAADVVLGARTGAMPGEPQDSSRVSMIILVRNNSGQPVPWLGVLGIGGPVIDPTGGSLTGTTSTDNRAREFVANPVMNGGIPSGGSQQVAVAIEPIENGKIGRMAISGRFACKVKVLSTSHGYARGRNGDVTQLISAECGPIRLLWVEDQGNDKFAAAMV